MYYYSEEIRLDILCEACADDSHMKCQALFSGKIKMPSAAIVVGTLWVNSDAASNYKYVFGLRRRHQ